YRQSFKDSSFIFSILTDENKADLQKQVENLLKKAPLPQYQQFQILDKYEEDVIVECGLSLRLTLKFPQIDALNGHPSLKSSWYVHRPYSPRETPDAELYIPMKLYEAWYQRENFHLTDFTHSQFVGASTPTNWLESTFSSGALLSKLIRHVAIWNQDWPVLLNLLSVSKTLNKRILNIGKTDQNLIARLRKEVGAFSVVTKSARSNLIPVLKKVRNKVNAHLVACESCFKIFYCDNGTFECVMEEPCERKDIIFHQYYTVYHGSDPTCEVVKKRRRLVERRLSNSCRHTGRYKIGSRAYLPVYVAPLNGIQEDEKEQTQNKKKRKREEEKERGEKQEEEEYDDEEDGWHLVN